MNAARWNLISSLAIISGAIIWLIKFVTILALEGKETVSGLPAVLYDLGLLLLSGGVVGIALLLTRYRLWIVRFVACIIAPPLFFSTYLVLEFLTEPWTPNSWPDYLQDEAGIAITAALWLFLGLGLISSRRYADKGS